jgi:Cytochrome C oxidase, cbb3-type, subunit III
MSSRATSLAIALLAACALSGCDNTLRQDMANQPRVNPLAPSEFFADGRSERPEIENTVARGSLVNDALNVPKDSNAFPLPLTKELMQRGQERYAIFCAPCHGAQGNGLGMVAMRGMKHPPNFYEDRLRAEPNGYYYDVVANGFGAMYGYSSQIPPKDRWAIIAYVRALQLSRNAPAGELPAGLREKLMAGGAAK